MAYCRNCGNPISDEAAVCSHCGTAQTEQTAQNPAPSTPPVVDNGGFGWGLLGCCVPIAGLVLFLVWKDTKPKTAKAAGIGALVSVIVAVIYYVVIMALGIGYGLLG